MENENLEKFIINFNRTALDEINKLDKEFLFESPRDSSSENNPVKKICNAIETVNTTYLLARHNKAFEIIPVDAFISGFEDDETIKGIISKIK